MPSFSIVIPCYNAADTIVETLRSLTQQTDRDWEAICVDDGSTDDTWAEITAFALADPRIRLVTHPGKGPSAARNAGIDMSNGGIVAFCDADDVWVPGKLARLRHLFETRGADAVFGRVGFWQGGSREAVRQSSVPTAPLSVPTLLAENPVCTMSNISVRKAWLKHERFDEALVHNEDLDWLIRLSGAGARIVGDDNLHMFYRTSRHGLSGDLSKMAKGRTHAIQTAARYGVVPTAADEAIFQRHLARRALRLEDGAQEARRHAWTGLRKAPSAFLFPLRRGLPTAVAALLSPLLPRRLRRALFSA